MGAHGEVAYVSSPQRFQTLALFCAISLLWAGSWICFAPLADIAEARFEVGPAAINTLASSFLFCYIPSSALCLYLVDRYGVRVSLTLSVTVNTGVVFVRWLALACDLPPHAAYAVNMTAQVRTSAAKGGGCCDSRRCAARRSSRRRCSKRVRSISQQGLQATGFPAKSGTLQQWLQPCPAWLAR